MRSGTLNLLCFSLAFCLCGPTKPHRARPHGDPPRIEELRAVLRLIEAARADKPQTAKEKQAQTDRMEKRVQDKCGTSSSTAACDKGQQVINSRRKAEGRQ